ncbi:MAG: glycosyltransferase family 39 protein [Candidatus Schekmanbacteria bacterium]|nr:glycosyltransferase family 39 protein [Candidatus Schekmanbacteria bacterium]
MTSSQKKLFLSGTILFAIFLLFFGLSSRDLWDPDEARYAEIAREMIESGDYISPHLNYEAYNKKPPLYFWLSAIAFNLTGMADYAPRYVTTLFGAGLLYLVFALGKNFFCFETGLLSLIILLTSIEFIALSHSIVTDMTLAFFITLSVFSFINTTGKYSPYSKIHRVILFISLGLGFMSKGPLGIIVPGIIIFFYILIFKEFESIKVFFKPTGILITLLVILPWYVASSIKTPGFLYENIVYENIMRYFTDVHERSGSIVYYIPVIIGGFFPWIFFLPFQATKSISNQTEDSRQLKFLIAWACAIFVFYSLSKSKLPNYILPIYPPLAMIAGKCWKDCFQRREDKGITLGIYAIFALFLSFDISALIILKFFPNIVVIVLDAIGLTALIWTLISLNIWFIVLVFLTYKNKKVAIFYMQVFLVVFIFLGAVINVDAFEKFKSNKKLALTLKSSAIGKSEIVFFKFFKPSFVFYSQRRILRIDHKFQLTYRLYHTNNNYDEYYIFRKKDFDRDLDELIQSKLVKVGENRECVIMRRREPGKKT